MNWQLNVVVRVRSSEYYNQQFSVIDFDNDCCIITLNCHGTSVDFHYSEVRAVDKQNLLNQAENDCDEQFVCLLKTLI